MKQCKWCKENKPFSEFTKNKREKDGHRRQCRKCSISYEKKRYHKDSFVRKTQARGQEDRQYRNRLFLYNYLKDKLCVDCGENDPIVLEFDHIKGYKKASISQLVAACHSLNTIQLEIDKCEIRCANCHRRKTSNQFSWYNKANPPLPKNKQINNFYEEKVSQVHSDDPTETSPNNLQDKV